MAMINLPINELNMAVLTAILEQGFSYIDDQPRNINQVISFLLQIADSEGYLSIEASELLDKMKRKERECRGL